MSANPSFKQMLDELRSIAAALPQAKQAYMDAESAYAARGTKSENVALTVANEYVDPKNNRANALVQSARKLEAGIKSFNNLRTSLSERLAILLVQFNLTATSLMVEATTWPVTASVKDTDPLDVVHSMLRDLNRQQARLVLLTARGVIVGKNVLDALQVATNLIKLRQGGLEQYLKRTPTIDQEKALAAVNVFGAEINGEGYKVLLEALAKAISEPVEMVFPFTKIASIGYELYAKIQELKKRRGRKSEDELLDFSDSVELDNQAFERDLEFFGSLTDALAKEVPL